MNQIASKSLVKGLVFGIVGALIGGLLWKLIAISTGTMYGLVALVSAAIAGASFGFPTRGGNKSIRGALGAVLGLASILLGYYFIYTSPLDLGLGLRVVPSDAMTFGEFWNVIAGPVDYLFLLIGLYEGAKLGSIE